MLPDAASVLANAHDSSLAISLNVDKSPPSHEADVGSKPWLLSRALGGGKERKAAGQGGKGTVQGGGAGGRTAKAGEKGVGGDADVLPEDQFHIRLPKGAIFFACMRMPLHT